MEMELDEDYIEYVAVFSLSILTAAASYFIDLSRPETFLILLLIPVTFGYTTYISQNGFRRPAVCSLIALFFITINPVTAVVAIIVGLGVPLISVFGGGNHFKDYFRTVSIPLIVLGLVLGASTFYIVSEDPAMRNQLIDTVATTTGEQAEEITERSNMIGDYKSTQTEMIEATSQASIQASKLYVINHTQNDLRPQQIQSVRNAFDSAETEIPERMMNQTQQNMDTSSVDISDQISSTVKDLISQKALIAIIPGGAIILYSLNPIIGLLTALAAAGFRALDREIPVSAVS